MKRKMIMTMDLTGEGDIKDEEQVELDESEDYEGISDEEGMDIEISEEKNHEELEMEDDDKQGFDKEEDIEDVEKAALDENEDYEDISEEEAMDIKIDILEDYETTENGVVKREIEDDCELIKKILKIKGNRNRENMRLNEEDIVKKEIAYDDEQVFDEEGSIKGEEMEESEAYVDIDDEEKCVEGCKQEF